MPAFYDDSVSGFLRRDASTIIGRLSQQVAGAGYYQQLSSQTAAWEIQIEVLRSALGVIAPSRQIFNWHIFLEYPIARRAKRIDTVILVGGLILVLEFKVGSKDFGREAIMQVEDYCLDLRDFHKASRGRTIVPILVATEAVSPRNQAHPEPDSVKQVRYANSISLAEVVRQSVDEYSESSAVPMDPATWNRSDYSPTPTIVESARSLYAGQNVKEISRCHAGIENLTTTSETIFRAVDIARQFKKKMACFVTGVPGAGKTLAGLNIVHNRRLHEGDLGVFMSGNIPLVKVLSEALARDSAQRQDKSLAEARREVSTFVQVVKNFITEYIEDKQKVPEDRIVVFDEAQRAWDAAQSKRKFHHSNSEPEMMLEILDRHKDWAVFVALVGNGQEIHTGEAGLSEWGRALEQRFKHWHVLISPELAHESDQHIGGLFPLGTKPTISITENRALHLRVSLRSYKAESLSEFVASLLALDSARCREILKTMPDYPIVLTRDLAAAKEWLRERRRGSRRIGLIASSGARRLRAHGLDVRTELEVEKWFLNPEDDVRSSTFLEVPATEFSIQGLELDWTGVCWGGDLAPKNREWACRSFKGTKWQIVRSAEKRQFIINKYRVLLTRAREGMVIWVPNGDSEDKTRNPKVYDRIVAWLEECGIPRLT